MTREADRFMPPLRRLGVYPEYRHSGFDWLGKIPAHWEVKPLKRLATLNDEVLSEGTDSNFEITYVDIGSVDAVSGITDKENLDFGKAPSRARRIVRDGDVIISTVRTYLRAIAAIRAPESNLVVSTGFAVVRPCHLASSFATYALRAPHFVESVVANSVGVSYPAINASRLACFVIPYPSLDEQLAIAEFLNREMTRIDTLVAKKKQLIELLQEKRLALITRAVTRGLDAKVPMKESGVEWLGKIPAHWELKRLKTLATVHLSNVDKKSVEGHAPVKLCNYVDVYYNDSITAEISFMSATATPDQLRRFGLRAGDVLITKDSETWDDIAVPAVAAEDLAGVVCGYHLALIRPQPSLDGRFLARQFSAIGLRDQFHIAAKGITRFGLGSDAIRTGRFPVAPVEEQRAIANFSDHETAKIDELIVKVEEAIDQLNELRTALISASVTGKIDVREAASRPDTEL